MFSNEGLGVQGRIGGQQEGQARAGDGYGPAEHRLMGYDRERLGGGGGIANTHTQEALQFQGKIIKFVEKCEPRFKCDKNMIFYKNFN
jgi:hypothetical protein